MGASAYIGRIGGLAAALGIGAVVLYGSPVAAADQSGQAGSESSSAPSGGSESSSPSKTTASERSAAKGSAGGSKSGAEKTSEPTDAKPSSTKSQADSEGSETLNGTKGSSEEKSTPGAQASADDTQSRSGSRSNKSRPSDNAAQTPKADRPAARTTSARPDPSAETHAVAEEDAVTSTVSVAAEPKVDTSITVAPDRVEPDIVVPITAEPPAIAPKNPVEVVATAISTLVASIASPFADSAPGSPPESPAIWTLLAAARRESFGTSPTLAVINPETNGLDAGAGAVPAPAASVALEQPPVVAIEQTPPLAWLQQVPILGPAFVTPIVAAIHLIPIVSDIVHPLIGYPVQWGVPAGTPVSRDVKVISFDGTQIYVHFMPATGLGADQKAPTILNGPGLGMPGTTNLNGELLDDAITDTFGLVSVATLRAAGYNVVTWDPRGEWNSGGQLEMDSPDFEARDVSAIISWLATQPEAQLDAPGDPRMGMVGASYGGGIQLVTAAADHRIDAIVPTIAWNSLTTSLDKSQAPKLGVESLLAAALIFTGARANPVIYSGLITSILTGQLPPADRQLLLDRGPGDLVKSITAPTLLIQGTVDTLFSLQEADANALDLITSGVPTKVLWFCGGHGVCTNDLLDGTDGLVIRANTLAWLAKYVKEDPNAVTGPQFEWVDQRGQYFSSTVYPAKQGPAIVASSGGGVLPLIPVLGGSGPLLLVLPIGGTAAVNALNLTVPAVTITTYVVGAPTLTMTYAGTGISRHVYAQLVDNSTGLVLGNQVTPIPVTLDGQSHTITIPLESVAQTLAPGQTVTLQIVASAATYESIWTAGGLNVSNIQLSLPTVPDATPISSPLG
jgi:ABC-2 type transport system ATP-binding protein